MCKKSAKLTFDELSTVLAEIECTLNSRPLTYSYDEPEEQVLTTSHLILGYRLSSLSENFHQEISSDDEENLCDKLSNRFIYLTRRLEYFWNGWHKEYVTGVREVHRQKSGEAAPIDTGDLVLIFKDNVKRGLWKVGVVDGSNKGADGNVRRARVRKPGRGKIALLNRPVQKLFPLESAKVKGLERKDGDSQSGGGRVCKESRGSERTYPVDLSVQLQRTRA